MVSGSGLLSFWSGSVFVKDISSSLFFFFNSFARLISQISCLYSSMIDQTGFVSWESCEVLETFFKGDKWPSGQSK